MLLVLVSWTVGVVWLWTVRTVRRLTVPSVLVLVPVPVPGLGRERVAPLVPRHHRVAVLVVLSVLGLLEHRSGTGPVHGGLTEVDWLRLSPGPPLGDGRRLVRRQLVGRVSGDVERLRVHRIDWHLLLARGRLQVRRLTAA